ncbi:hypothetical protein Micbo1qcDRAFT_53053 [Microdochium bolleyi]|uniref:Uncharacterized protein n=1 Tax=Microdochium bolleyi TaxID=196109 RepID=A0A136J7C5_9PEZI|nr:hypothetical protein Micbo1qcDRAFT_53053 [Microdochium bolleyi]
MFTTLVRIVGVLSSSLLSGNILSSRVFLVRFSHCACLAAFPNRFQERGQQKCSRVGAQKDIQRHLSFLLIYPCSVLLLLPIHSYSSRLAEHNLMYALAPPHSSFSDF